MISKKLIAPAVIGVTAFTGVAAGTTLNGLVASADTASSASTSSDSASSDTSQANDKQRAARDESKGGHMANGKTETLLTGDNAAKATAAAEKAVSGGTVLRVETDAEGDAYEAHVRKSDGSQVTVKMDDNFVVTTTEDGPAGGSPHESSDPNAN